MRGGIFHRYFSASQESCSNMSSGAAYNNNMINGSVPSATCQSDYLSGNAANAQVARNGGVGGPEPYRQSDWSIQDVFSGVAHLKTGHIRHEIIGGFDIEYVTDHRQNYAYGSNRPSTSLLDPSPYVPGLTLGDCSQCPNRLVNIGNGVGRKCYKDSSALDVGFFLSDQVWLTKNLSVKAGFRWDHWNSTYSATGGSTATPDVSYGQNETTINPSVSIIHPAQQPDGVFQLVGIHHAAQPVCHQQFRADDLQEPERRPRAQQAV